MRDGGVYSKGFISPEQKKGKDGKNGKKGGIEDPSILLETIHPRWVTPSSAMIPSCSRMGDALPVA